MRLSKLSNWITERYLTKKAIKLKKLAIRQILGVQFYLNEIIWVLAKIPIDRKHVKKVNWHRNHAQNQEDFISNNLIYNQNAAKCATASKRTMHRFRRKGFCLCSLSCCRYNRLCFAAAQQAFNSQGNSNWSHT